MLRIVTGEDQAIAPLRGKSRVYVSTPRGKRVGRLDLRDGSRHLEAPEHAAAFDAPCSLRGCYVRGAHGVG